MKKSITVLMMRKPVSQKAISYFSLFGFIAKVLMKLPLIRNFPPAFNAMHDNGVI
jgi:hypothetical protein